MSLIHPPAIPHTAHFPAAQYLKNSLFEHRWHGGSTNVYPATDMIHYFHHFQNNGLNHIRIRMNFVQNNITSLQIKQHCFITFVPKAMAAN